MLVTFYLFFKSIVLSILHEFIYATLFSVKYVDHWVCIEFRSFCHQT